MRVAFAKSFLTVAARDPRVIFLTGDLGFNAFEPLQRRLKDRFINAGVAEHNMVTAAAGLAYTGLQPWVYSIAPFVTIKVVEEIRNDICLQGANVKIVGLGGGYDYGLAGPTHHALQDVAAILSLPNIKVYAPGFAQDVAAIVKKMHREKTPAYLRLTKGQPTDLRLPPYAPSRRIAKGAKMTVVALGSIAKPICELVAQKAVPSGAIDLWVVSELPQELPPQLLGSIRKTKTLMVVEEHVKTGGLGQWVTNTLVERRVPVSRYIHLYAKGYTTKRYGSHEFYLRQTGLDKGSIARTLRRSL